MDEVSAAMMALKQGRKYMTMQQIRTVKGQILSGHIIGAMKGLDKILARQAVFSRGPLRQVAEKL